MDQMRAQRDQANEQRRKQRQEAFQQTRLMQASQIVSLEKERLKTLMMRCYTLIHEIATMASTGVVLNPHADDQTIMTSFLHDKEVVAKCQSTDNFTIDLRYFELAKRVAAMSVYLTDLRSSLVFIPHHQ